MIPNVIEISNFSSPDLDVFARLTEPQLRSRQHPEKALFIAESIKVIELALGAGCTPISLLMERRHINGQAKNLISRCEGIPIYTADAALLANLTGFRLTRGVLCAMRRPPLLAAEKICTHAHRVVVLENIMDSTNLGAIFRSAAALGIDAVLLTPSCCDPLCRRSVRVSMGTVFQVPWGYLGQETDEWLQNGIPLLHNWGFQTVALALRASAIRIDNPKLAGEKKLAILLGTEDKGLSPGIIAACDYTACIPMSHQVDSLNVAAASAVAFWELRVR